MKAKLVIDGKQHDVEISQGDTLRSVLEKNDLNEETGLVKLNGATTHPLTLVKQGDSVEFVNIIYGG